MTNLLIWRDFSPSISLLSCFLPELLPVECLGSRQLALCTRKGGRFGWGVDFHRHNMVRNPSCWLLFLLPHPGPGTRQETPRAAVVSPRQWPPWMTSTAWFFPSPMRTTLSFCTSPPADSDQSQVQVPGNPLVTGSTYLLLKTAFPTTSLSHHLTFCPLSDNKMKSTMGREFTMSKRCG